MPDQRQIFFEAAEFFLAAAERVRDDQWAVPGLGVWSVRELVGHTSRAFTNIERDLVTPVRRSDVSPGGTLDTAVDHFGRGMATPGIHESVAQRGRQAGRQCAEPCRDPIVVASGVEGSHAALPVSGLRIRRATGCL